jgi:hypothetical protein
MPQLRGNGPTLGLNTKCLNILTRKREEKEDLLVESVDKKCKIYLNIS